MYVSEINNDLTIEEMKGKHRKLIYSIQIDVVIVETSHRSEPAEAQGHAFHPECKESRRTSAKILSSSTRPIALGRRSFRK